MTVYFDTSAIVKLLVAEPGSEIARRVWAIADTVAFSRLAEPEARAALAWARRLRRITPAQHRLSKTELSRRFESGAWIEVSAAICSRAGELAEEHALRGYDAVHLASAIAAGPEIMIATWDRDLRTAARRMRMGLIPARVGQIS